MKSLIAVLALLLAACAATKPEPTIKEATYPPHEIKIVSQPPGALIDWNGQVLGMSPVTLVIQPHKYRHSWPYNGLFYQVLRARWQNGASRFEFFDSNAPLPDHVVIM